MCNTFTNKKKLVSIFGFEDKILFLKAIESNFKIYFQKSFFNNLF